MVSDFQRKLSGHSPNSVTAVMREAALVITFCDRLREMSRKTARQKRSSPGMRKYRHFLCKTKMPVNRIFLSSYGNQKHGRSTKKASSHGWPKRRNGVPVESHLPGAVAISSMGIFVA